MDVDTHMSLSDEGMTRNLPSDARLELNGARVDVQLGLDECESSILQASSRALGQRVVDPIAERLEYAIMSVIFADILKLNRRESYSPQRSTRDGKFPV